MAAKPKLSMVKKANPDSEFETLLRRSSEYLKLRGPQLVRKIRSTGRLPLSLA